MWGKSIFLKLVGHGKTWRVAVNTGKGIRWLLRRTKAWASQAWRWCCRQRGGGGLLATRSSKKIFGSLGPRVKEQPRDFLYRHMHAQALR